MGVRGAVWPDGETDRAIRGMLDDAVREARHSHPQVRTGICTAHAPAALTLIDRSSEARLVVVGCRGHSGAYDLLGSVSVAVGAHAHCPVVVVRGGPAATGPVVARVDDSDRAPPVLAFGFEQASARGVPLRVVHADAGSGPDRFLDDLLTGWREKYPDVEVAVDVLPGHPPQELVTAGTTAQLVVVGSRGRGALRGMLLGSVGRHLLHHAACTVAVVPAMHP